MNKRDWHERISFLKWICIVLSKVASKPKRSDCDVPGRELLYGTDGDSKIKKISNTKNYNLLFNISSLATLNETLTAINVGILPGTPKLDLNPEIYLFHWDDRLFISYGSPWGWLLTRVGFNISKNVHGCPWVCSSFFILCSFYALTCRILHDLIGGER